MPLSQLHGMADQREDESYLSHSESVVLSLVSLSLDGFRLKLIHPRIRSSSSREIIALPRMFKED